MGRNKQYIGVFTLLIVAFSAFVYSSSRSNLQTYPFVNEVDNVILNENSGIEKFYALLYDLEFKKIQRVNITHIGDSHIQADLWTGQIRRNLQAQFGNAGRGYVFPYALANTHGSSGVTSSSNVQWSYKRNTNTERLLPTGLGAFVIDTKKSEASVSLSVQDEGVLDYSFSKLKLYHDKGANNYALGLKYGGGITSSWDIESSDSENFASTVSFNTPQRNVVVYNKAHQDSLSRNTRIYGFLLENDSVGVLYNTIGSNGAEYRHYLNSAYFIKQLPALKSDLIILSMGTNEGYLPGFNASEFDAYIDSLVNRIKRTNPEATLLITTPPDSYRREGGVKVLNLDIKKVRARLLAYCKAKGISYWDMYSVLGGHGSMKKWHLAGLASGDKIHFSRKGYKVQGDLFYNALMKGYEAYKRTKTE